MKNLIVNLIAKLAGIKSLWEKADGYGTYIAGSGIVLLGASMLLGDIASLWAAHDAAGILAFLKGITQHGGTLKILEGVAILRLRRAVAK